MSFLVPCSIGDLADRVTILDIKLERITDKDKIKNIRREREALKAVWYELNPTKLTKQMGRLRAVNELIWELEDLARKETVKDPAFLLTRITRANDERARIKREINEQTKSEFVEEKSY